MCHLHDVRLQSARVVCIFRDQLVARLHTHIAEEEHSAAADIQTIRNRDTTTSEDPYQESNFYAPETMIASSLMKKVSREYEQVGDPALIPHKAHAEKS